MNKEVLEKTIAGLDELIEEKAQARREEIIRVFDTISERFISAPASTSTNYHSCYRGGLLQHTYNVIRAMYKLNDPLYACDEESILVCGLFHDMGKIGSINPDIDMYIDLPSEEQWRERRYNAKFMHNPELNDCLTHSLRSIRNLEKLNFPLTDEEFVAIFQHDGYFAEQNRSVEMMRCTFPLVKLIQHADQIMTINEKDL